MPRDNVARFRVERGTPRRRRRFTKSTKLFNGTMLLTAEQWSELETFYLTTLGGGSEAFGIPKPITASDGEFVTVKFAERPSRVPEGANWRVTLQLRTA